MTRPILIATDVSPAADVALTEGDERARAANATVVICHVVPRVPAKMVPPDLVPRTRALIEERVLALIGRKPGEYQLVIDEGTPQDVIVEQAERWGAGLVVVGGTGSGGFTRLLLGSVSERVVRHAACPVLVARPSPTGGPVIGGTDFSDPALPALAAAREQAARRQCKLLLCHFLEIAALTATAPTEGFVPAVPPDSITALERAARERLIEAAGKVNATGADLRVGIGEPGHSLVELAEKEQAGLVVVGTHGRTGVARVFMGSVAERVVRHAPCSVLVVRLTSG